MPVDCTGHLTADITFDCAHAPIGGIEQNVVLINKDDIDVINTTTDPSNRLLVTNLQLKAGKVGYLLSGVKQSNSKAWELVKKENAPDKFKHTFSGVIFNPSLANKQQADSLAKGAKYVAVVEQVWKGAASADAFEILGFASGLEITTMADGQANRALDANMLTKEIKIAGKTPVLAPYVDVTDSLVLTGTTTETILKSYLVSANDISAGTLDLSSVFEFSGTAGIKILRIYKNTVNSLTGATLIATNSLVAASTYTVFNRPFVVKPNNILYGYNAYFASAEITTGASGSLALSAVFYPTVNNYFIVTAQLGSTSDSITQKSFTLTYKRAT